MKVLWASAAEQDRADIIDCISQDNPLAAIRMDELFAEAAGRLAEHPNLGRAGLILGTRELIPPRKLLAGYAGLFQCGHEPEDDWFFVCVSGQ